MQKAPVLPHSIWLYIPLWIFFVYLFVAIMQFKVDAPGNVILAGMYFVEFGVHEVSHLATMFFPPLMTALAGSIGEISFTLLFLYAALKSKAYFAACFAGLWVMLALKSVGNYIADARTQAIPLVGPGETVQHDWAFILGQLNALTYDTLIGGIVVSIGTLIGVASLFAGAYLIFVKLRYGITGAGIVRRIK